MAEVEHILDIEPAIELLCLAVVQQNKNDSIVYTGTTGGL